MVRAASWLRMDVNVGRRTRGSPGGIGGCRHFNLEEESMKAPFGFSSKNAAIMALLPLVGLQSCSSASSEVADAVPSEDIATVGQAISAGDDITEAFNTFKA